MLVVSANLWIYIMKLACFTTWLLCTCIYIWVIWMKLMMKDRSMCFWLYFITSLMFKSSLIVKESVVEENDSLKLTVLMTLRTSRIIIETLRWAFLRNFRFFMMNCSLSSSDEILNEVKLSVLSTVLLKHCMKFSCSLLLRFSIAWTWNRLIASSRVLEFESSIQLEKYQVELKFFWKSVESSWEVELKHLSWVEKLDSTTRLENSTQLDKILDKCK